VQNFRRRDFCFKCEAARPEADEEARDETSDSPTATVLLRGLDTLTTEDAVLSALRAFTHLPIKSIRIGRDTLTNTSRGVCYVEMNSRADSSFLHNALLAEPPTIDDKLVSVSYYRAPGSKEANSGVADALAAARWSNSSSKAAAEELLVSKGPPYTPEEVEKLAVYSAAMYAKTDQENAYYLNYYRDYYAKAKEAPSHATASSPAAAAPKATKEKAKKNAMVIVDGVEYKRYREHSV